MSNKLDTIKKIKVIQPITVNNDNESKDYSDEVRKSVEDNVKTVANASSSMSLITDQGRFEAFFSKGNNIRTMAQNVSAIATVEKSTLDLILLLMNADIGHKQDYDIIMQTLSEMRLGLDDDNIAIEQIIRIKKAIQGLQTRDALFEEIIKKINLLIDALSRQEETISKMGKEIDSQSKNNRSIKFIVYIAICTGAIGIVLSLITLTLLS